jgi:hypothetical protein
LAAEKNAYFKSCAFLKWVNSNRIDPLCRYEILLQAAIMALWTAALFLAGVLPLMRAGVCGGTFGPVWQVPFFVLPHE